MTRFLLRISRLTVFTSFLFVSACSAGSGKGGAEQSSPGESNRGGATNSQEGEPGDGTGGDSSSGAEVGTSTFDEYEVSCEEEECTDDEICLETQSGTACHRPCPGQPCPSEEANNSYCDRFGGVTCTAD